MNRTYIIAADGTRFEEIAARTATRRKIIRRTIGGIALILTALFLSAAIIGLRHAAGVPDTIPSHTPSMSKTSSQLIATNIRTMQRACAKAPRGSKQDCMALYLRGAWFDAHNYTPAGPALVKECISQYRGAELADCFTQEIG